MGVTSALPMRLLLGAGGAKRLLASGAVPAGSGVGSGTDAGAGAGAAAGGLAGSAGGAPGLRIFLKKLNIEWSLESRYSRSRSDERMLALASPALTEAISLANLLYNMKLLHQSAPSIRLAQVVRGFAAAGLMAGIGTAGLPAAAQALSPVDEPVRAVTPTNVQAQQFTLSNGMTLIVKPDRRSPTVAHMLWVRVGSIDEVDGTSGVAHVLEHMMFKGTPTLKPGEFSRRMAALGGRDNAFTSRDATAYHQQIPANRLEEVMRLEADRFANTQWDDAEFKREIEVVKEERRLRVEDAPRAQLYEVANAIAFAAAPYRRPIIGWMSDLDAMTPADVRSFFRQWYVPGNAAVVIAGDVDVAQVRDLAERIYGALPAGQPAPERKPRIEPLQSGKRQLEHKASASQAYATLMFKVPKLEASSLSTAAPEPGPSRDALALTVLAAVLDGYSGARLDRALTQGEGRVADSAGAYNGLLGRGPQVFVMDGVPAEGKTAAEVIAALRQQVSRIAREGVSEAELKRVKTQWVAAEVYKLDALFNQARELGSNWINGFPLDANARLVAQLRTITAAEVQAVAARYFGDDQLTQAVLVPQPMQAPRAPRLPVPGARH
jgi:zinc protease